MDESQKLNIPTPPDFVFKYRKNRVNPSNDVIAEQTMFVFKGMKYPALKYKSDEWLAGWGIDKTKLPEITAEEEKLGGQLAYFEGTLHPNKGHPFPQYLYALGQIKRILRNGIYVLAQKDWITLFLRKSRKRMIARILYAYIDLCEKNITPFILDNDFRTPCAQETFKFIFNFATKIGIDKSIQQEMQLGTGASYEQALADIGAEHIEGDNAYRWKLQDLFSKTTKEKMIENPRKVLKEWAALVIERDIDKDTAKKFARMLKTVSYCLLIPKFKRIFKECFQESDFKRFQSDYADEYHQLLMGDYKFAGKTIDQRVEIYKRLHEKIGYPPRITIKPQ